MLQLLLIALTIFTYPTSYTADHNLSDMLAKFDANCSDTAPFSPFRENSPEAEEQESISLTKDELQEMFEKQAERLTALLQQESAHTKEYTEAAMSGFKQEMQTQLMFNTLMRRTELDTLKLTFENRFRLLYQRMVALHQPPQLMQPAGQRRQYAVTSTENQPAEQQSQQLEQSAGQKRQHAATSTESQPAKRQRTQDPNDPFKDRLAELWRMHGTASLKDFDRYLLLLRSHEYRLSAHQAFEEINKKDSKDLDRLTYCDTACSQALSLFLESQLEDSWLAAEIKALDRNIKSMVNILYTEDSRSKQ